MCDDQLWAMCEPDAKRVEFTSWTLMDEKWKRFYS